MSDPEKKKKEYEPPVIKEIGESFEQAMGISNCLVGSAFSVGPCVMGRTAAGGCSLGQSDRACTLGASDMGDCTMGQNAAGSCIVGPSV